jgi:hypothetical protein
MVSHRVQAFPGGILPKYLIDLVGNSLAIAGREVALIAPETIFIGLLLPLKSAIF